MSSIYLDIVGRLSLRALHVLCPCLEHSYFLMPCGQLLGSLQMLA